jgi:hypothetical protein
LRIFSEDAVSAAAIVAQPTLMVLQAFHVGLYTKGSR